MVKIHMIEAVLTAAFLIALQFFIFMIFRNSQASRESEKLIKLNDINAVDGAMYLVLCISAVLGFV